MSSTRVCLIGAGPSGMSTLFHFAKLPEQPELVCYEKQDKWGGLWNYTWRTGVDEYGEPCHAGMYRDLWTNGPKECAEFPDYTYERHFGKAVPSFPPREVMRDYLEGRANSVEGVNLQRHIQFNTAVRSVKYDDKNDVFKVVVNHLKSGEIGEETFTHVIVASGIFNTPNLPNFPGFDNFPGRISHSHDFRDGRQFKDKALLVIGGSYSAEDVALHAIKNGAKSVIISWRSKPLNLVWPAGIEERPLLEKVSDRTVFFVDGSTAEVDEIVLCTGYQNHFPFLEDRLQIERSSAYYPAGLYKGSLYLPAGNRRLFYVGDMVQAYTFTLFDCQAAWVCRYITGQLQGEPKSEEEMEKDDEIWRNKSLEITCPAEFVAFQTEIVAMLADATGLPKEMAKAKPLFMEWLQHRQEGIASFRNHSFRSIYTGTLAPPSKVPFMSATDDSLKTFLENA